MNRSIIDELNSNSWDVQGDQMESEDDMTRNTIDELYSWDAQRDQREGGSGVARSIIDELHGSDI